MRTCASRTQLAELCCCWGSGFSIEEQGDTFLSIMPLRGYNARRQQTHAWTAARVGAAAARSIPPPHISQPRPPQPQ